MLSQACDRKKSLSVRKRLSAKSNYSVAHLSHKRQREQHEADAYLTAPADGHIASIFPKQGELVAPGAAIMNLVVLTDGYVVFNIREDLMPHIRMGKQFAVSVPALARTDVPMTVYYISPLGSFATWKSTKEVGTYDMRTFEIRLRPEHRVEGLRPGMTAIIELKDDSTIGF